MYFINNACRIEDFYSDVFIVYLCTLFVYVCLLVYAESISFSLTAAAASKPSSSHFLPNVWRPLSIQ